MFEITMSGPGKNALGTAMMQFLEEQLEEAAGRPVLLTGAGDSFSAGLDLVEVASFDASSMATFLRRLEAVCSKLYHYPGPTVAHVNGHAIAGGCILALCCDYRVATNNPKARIGLNEVALGLRFPPSLISLVRSRVPAHQLETVVLGAALHAPADALRLGLVDEVPDDPAWTARERLQALARHPVEAYAANKRDLHGEPAFDEAANRRFVEEVLPYWTSDALKQRIAAVLKR